MRRCLAGSCIRVISLLTGLALTSVFLFSSGVSANPGSMDKERFTVLDPEIVREDLEESDIGKNDFEFGIYGGLLSVEDFGVNTVIGAALTYHVTEDFFFVAQYGQSPTEATSYELLSLGSPLLNDDERDLSYYNINIGYRILPGEAFVGSGRAFNVALYFILGAGNTEFGGDSRFTINAGVGYQFLALDWLSLKLECRDHIFDVDLLAETKTAHNLEFSLGMSVFF
ncbi:MAG: outer membrane beta-barrel domain-containing protein [Pseudomonadales bacterium]|nr:outer membrane beta-barrel domain-containing protein [Pseudomonadales bacterium]